VPSRSRDSGPFLRRGHFLRRNVLILFQEVDRCKSIRFEFVAVRGDARKFLEQVGALLKLGFVAVNIPKIDEAQACSEHRVLIIRRLFQDRFVSRDRVLRVADDPVEIGKRDLRFRFFCRIGLRGDILRYQDLGSFNDRRIDLFGPYSLPKRVAPLAGITKL